MPETFLQKQAKIDSSWQNFLLSGESLKQWLNNHQPFRPANWRFYNELLNDFNTLYLKHVELVKKSFLENKVELREIHYRNEHLNLIAPQYRTILGELDLIKPLPPILASHTSSSNSTSNQCFFPLPQAEEQEIWGEIFPYSPIIYEGHG